MVLAIRRWRYLVVLGFILVGAASFAVTASSTEAADRCQASGSTLGAARAAYGNSCQAPRADCDPIGGRWICSSEQIGSNSPKRAQQQSAEPAQRSSQRTASQDSQPTEGEGLSATQQQEIFVAVLQQLPADQQQSFIEQVEALSPAERQQLAAAILLQQQTQPTVQSDQPTTPEPSTPAQSPVEARVSEPSDQPEIAQSQTQPGTDVLSAEQQQQIFAAVLQQLPAESQQSFITQLQELTPDQRQRLALSILQDQQGTSQPTSTQESEPVAGEPERADATAVSTEATPSNGPTTATEDAVSDEAATNLAAAPPGSVAYRGVTNEQWSEIASQRSQFGDPNDCRARVASISGTADVIVQAGDAVGIQEALDSGARVIQLQGGTYQIPDTVKIGSGQQLLGAANGEPVTINASGSETGVSLGNNAILANVSVMNADNRGVVLAKSGLVYRVSVGRPGYSSTSNTTGAGFSMVGGGTTNNCVVSSEAFEGFNEDGRSCESCANGGNADGVAVKAGAFNNSFIDTHSYRNSDDGFDFWDGGTNYVYFGSAYDNGKTPGRPNGDGNGYKLGRGDATHYLYRARAYTNRVDGIDLNNNSKQAVLIRTESTGNGNLDFDRVANR